jgi:hypothetical protein
MRSSLSSIEACRRSLARDGVTEDYAAIAEARLADGSARSSPAVGQRWSS